MRAITVSPGVPNSARLEDIDEPPASQGSLLVRALALGVCGTDRELIRGDYGEAPDGRDRPGSAGRSARRGGIRGVFLSI